MRTIGLFEAKQKPSELVERASEGERIGITRRGKLAAMIVSAKSGGDLKEVFAGIERIRRRARQRTTVSIRNLIEKGRS